MFYPVVELKNPIGISTKEVKAEMEIHPVTAKSKLKKCLIKFRVVQTFFF